MNRSAALTKHGHILKAWEVPCGKKIFKDASSSEEAAFVHEGTLVIDLSFIVTLLGTAVKLNNFCGLYEAIWKHLTHIGSKNGHMDTVCDNYHDQNLLKQGTKSSMDSGCVRDFVLESPIPTDFGKDFMKSIRNTEKL